MIDTPRVIQRSDGLWMLEGEQLWDTTILPVCLEHIKEGDIVIDAGAWIGGHTMAYAKKVGENGKVISFEPNPLAFTCLYRNETPFLNVTSHKVALSNYYDTVPFSARRGWYDSGHLGYVGKEYIHDADTIAEVNVRPLDHYEISPNFIKIDVEGCELKALKGAVKTIEKHRPIIVLEINRPALERQGATREQVFDWLIKNDYTYAPIDNYMNDVYNILALP